MVGMAEGASHHFVATRNPVERGTEHGRGHPPGPPAGRPGLGRAALGPPRLTRPCRCDTRLTGSPAAVATKPDHADKLVGSGHAELRSVFSFPNPVNEVAARVVAGGVVRA